MSASAYSVGQVQVLDSVLKAVEEIRDRFPDNGVTCSGDGSGGAFVLIDDVPLGDLYVQSSTWLAFQVTYLYPAADVYPHFVRPDLSRVDGQPLSAGFSRAAWGFDGRSATQISRRSNRWNPNVDTAALKAVKVLAWLDDPN